MTRWSRRSTQAWRRPDPAVRLRGRSPSARRLRRDGPPGPAARPLGVRRLRVCLGGRGLVAGRRPGRFRRDRLSARRPDARAGRPVDGPLIGLRLASAVARAGDRPGVAGASGSSRGPVVAVAGLVLIPSALASDVGSRASGRFGVLAIAQVDPGRRAWRSGPWWLVVGPGRRGGRGGVRGRGRGWPRRPFPGDRVRHGRIRPRFRRRAWSVLARRGAVAGLTRFGRVTLYAADLLASGVVVGRGPGSLRGGPAGGFAVLALGLVVPSAIGPEDRPSLGHRDRPWLGGDRADDLGCSGLWPAGDGRPDRRRPTAGCRSSSAKASREGGPWLALIAARLPFVLASNVQQAALVACRREGRRSG